MALRVTLKMALRPQYMVWRTENGSYLVMHTIGFMKRESLFGVTIFMGGVRFGSLEFHWSGLRYTSNTDT